MKQLIYLNGKIDLVNNIFTFENSDSFGYGNYEPNEDEDYSFITFRPQNTQIYLKIKIDCIYAMCYREQVEIKCLLKIKQKFKENPIQSVSGNNIPLNEHNKDNNYFYQDEKLVKNKEKVDELFERQTQIENQYLEELIIYKIDE